MQTASLPTLESPSAAAAWLRQRGARRLRTDHRQVAPGDAFLAWPGYRHDARLHVDAAMQAGAVACLMEAEGGAVPAGWAGESVTHRTESPLAALPGLKRQAGAVADAFLGAPSAALDVLAVTGTNGKTSTTWWLAQALGRLGQRCAVVGTLGVGEPGGAAPAATGLTTPDAVALQHALAAMRDDGVRACAMEASSIGLVEHRMAGVRVAVAAFTNLTRDHLDYHGTMQAYGAAKRTLFDAPGLRAAVVNVDDAFGASLLPGLPAVPCWTVSSQPGREARLRAEAIEEAVEVAVDEAVDDRADNRADNAANGCGRPGGLAFTLREGDTACAVRTALVGRFNVDNLLIVAACLRALGHPLRAVADALGTLKPVPGRMERVDPSAGAGVVGLAPADAAGSQTTPTTATATGMAFPQLPEVVVDYAHTPDALAQALAALAPRARARGGCLWCVFGCGGERDASKRAPMGAAAAAGAQRVVVTSDNPRTEAPRAIIDQVLEGIPRGLPQGAVRVVEDRRRAIAEAIDQAAPQDVVLVAGKGHETTQDIGGYKHPFSDREEAAAALRRRIRAVLTSTAGEVRS